MSIQFKSEHQLKVTELAKGPIIALLTEKLH